MNHTRHRPVALLAIASGVLLAALPADAQDALQGRRLFEDTPAVSGINTLTGACTSCHGTVENRRAKISGGDPFAEIAPATASDRFRLAVASVPPMAQFDALSTQQVADIAAYLADTPRRSADRLDFEVAAPNIASSAQVVELNHAVATAESLQVLGVAVGGAQAARFTRSADTCDLQTLPPAGGCRVTLTYASPDTAAGAATLTFTLRQGAAGAPFTRSVALAGTVAAPAPVPGPAPAESGGGAFGQGWLAGLAAAVALLLGVGRRGGASLRNTRPLENTP